MRRLIARIAISLLAIVGIVTVVYFGIEVFLPLARGHSRSAPTLVYFVLMMCVSLIVAALALFVVWRAPLTAVNAHFTLFLAGLATVSADDGKFYWSESIAGILPGRIDADTFAGWFFAVTLAACLGAGLRWSQLFPQPLIAESIRRHVRPRAFGSVQVALAQPWAAWITIGGGGALALVLSMVLLDRLVALQIVIVLSIGIFTLVSATTNLWANYKDADAAERTRIFWVLEAGVVASTLAALAFIVEVAVHGLNVDAAVLSWLHAVLLPIALLAEAILLAIAVLYAGAIDSRLVIRKTLIFGATGLALTAVFVTIEVVVSNFIVGRFGLPPGLGGWIAALVVALAVGPVKVRVDRRISAVLQSRRVGAG
jgi:hypothetical protein